MAKAMVKCKFCGEYFDRNDKTINFIKLKNRYAHKKCYDAQDREALQEQKDWSNLISYANQILGEDFEFVKTQKQLESYKTKYNFTYSGMYKALKWFYEIDNGNKDNANGGIGILPYIYEKAYKYYYDLFQKQQRNAAAAPYHTTVQVVHIPSPRVSAPPPRLFDLGED